jgi:hypothetical protein
VQFDSIHATDFVGAGLHLRKKIEGKNNRDIPYTPPKKKKIYKNLQQSRENMKIPKNRDIPYTPPKKKKIYKILLKSQ